MKDMKFVIIILLMFFGVGIMAQINDYDYNVNNTGIMYQENNNIALNENNRYYDYDIDFNLDESYLHYSPVKKGGLLDSLYNDKSKNLAVPDLTGKDYLGDGDYVLYQGDGTNIVTYNVNTGIYNYKNDGNDIISLDIISNLTNLLSPLTEYTFTYNIISGFINTSWRPQVVVGDMAVSNIHTSPTFQINDILPYNYLALHYGITVGDYEFTIQIEKGTESTPYTVPYIPALKIDFNGTNQVEYINPFEEQIIEINDINNVYNIEFELLNTKNPAVFNWNITTNPNIPFVRFYNNQTKLLYDFTDVKEMNSIGNSLVGSRSNMINIFNNALDLVNTFYEGFQKLFNTETIENIRDALSGFWPLLPPQWPWLR